MTRKKIIFRRAKTLLWTAFSILVVLAAVGVGVGRLLMPYSERYQPELEAWLSREFGQPVKLESFEGDWTAFGPRLSLRGMKLLPPRPADGSDAEPEVVIESAALDIKPLNLLLPGLPLYNFRLIGADFELLHSADGRFHLSGFGVSRRGDSSQSSALKELARVGEVLLEDSRLIYTDELHGIELGFASIRGRLHLEDDELSTEVEAKLYDRRSELVYGEIEATLLLILDDDQKMSHAAWQATARELMLAAFQGRVPQNPFLPLTGWLSAEAWGNWSRDDGLSIRGVSDLTDAWLVNEHQDLELAQVNTRFRWNYAGRGDWNLHLADFHYDDGDRAWTAPRISLARRTEQGLGLWISADELPLDVPLNLTRDVMSIYDTAWPRFLPQRAAGQVRELDVVLNPQWRLERASGRLSGAAVTDWDRWPDLRGLDGEVDLHKGFGRLRLAGETVDVEWPRMFRAPLELAIPGCELDLRWGGAWQVNFSRCRVENDDLALAGDVVLSSNEGKPAVDVNVALQRGSIGRLDPYWPESIMKPNIKRWLRRGLLDGEITSGRFQIRGDMDNWPFLDGSGRFEAYAAVQGGRIDYLEGWPAAGGVDAFAHFVGASMDISGSVGDIGGVPVPSVQARIGNLKRPVLELDYRSSSDLPAYLGFVRQTPLLERLETDLTEFTFAGPARTRGTISVPLGRAKEQRQLSVDGEVTIEDGLFSDPLSEVTLSHIAGDLAYDENGFKSSGLDTEFRGSPGRLDLVADFRGNEKFRADLDGVFPVQNVIPEFLLQDFLALNQVGGDCRWQVSLTVSSQPGAERSDTVLRVASGLEGVAMDLPAPMNKAAGVRWPFLLRYPISGPDRLLDVVFQDVASLRFDLSGEDSTPRSAVIHLGPERPELPREGYVRLEGSSDFIDLDGWIDVVIGEVEGGTEGTGLDLEGGDLVAGKLRFLDRHYDNVSMQFQVEGSDIDGRFESEDLEGKLRFTVGETGMNSLSAEFERLAMGEPVSSGVDMESNPSDLPALHLYVRSFSYLGAELGETRIEAYPTADGFHFEKVDASSDRLSVQATGDWYQDETGHRSDFDIHMVSESLGDFLKSMDISSSVEGGQTLVDFNAWWPGSPASFGLSRLNGQIDFSVVNGNITNASAGTGRLLGLLSIQALPRRLALDFRDVFDSGFSFDEAAGTFVMENGSAQAQDVVLKSSAASINISGRTDLVGREYDQVLTIRPGVGNTLPIIGALAAGPGGAAAGLALQGLLHEQLAEATRVQYSIKGPWDDPQFEPVDIERAGG
jgi:uncharacterized protein (TIGR02099 family)